MSKIKYICPQCQSIIIEKKSIKTFIRSIWEFFQFISVLLVLGFVFFGYLYPYIIERFLK